MRGLSQERRRYGKGMLALILPLPVKSIPVVFMFDFELWEAIGPLNKRCVLSRSAMASSLLIAKPFCMFR